MKEPLDATVIRRAGEAADGRREEDLVFAEGIDGEVTFTTQQDAAAKGLKVKLRISTGFTQPGLRKKVRLFLLYDNKGLLLDEGVDAVFLTQSAVEKFVLPYYTRTCEPKEIQELRDKLFDDARCVAAPHVPPSVTTGVPGLAPTNEIGVIDELSPEWAPMSSFSQGIQTASQTAKLSSGGVSKQGSSATAAP